jgi:hypothetical protein
MTELPAIPVILIGLGMGGALVVFVLGVQRALARREG